MKIQAIISTIEQMMNIEILAVQIYIEIQGGIKAPPVSGAFYFAESTCGHDAFAA
jgi:hypothetical protein